MRRATSGRRGWRGWGWTRPAGWPALVPGGQGWFGGWWLHALAAFGVAGVVRRVLSFARGFVIAPKHQKAQTVNYVEAGKPPLSSVMFFLQISSNTFLENSRNTFLEISKKSQRVPAN